MSMAKQLQSFRDECSYNPVVRAGGRCNAGFVQSGQHVYKLEGAEIHETAGL